MDHINFTQILFGVAGTAITGLVAWLGIAGRKAIGNLGKTEVELRMEESMRAVAALEKAHQTPEKEDDLPAEKAAEVAKTKLSIARRLKAVTDSLAETSTPSE